MEKNNDFDILYDTLVFNYQTFGGISHVFYEFIQRELRDRKNVFFMEASLPIRSKDFLSLPQNLIHSFPERLNNYRLLTFSKAHIPSDLNLKPVIFHSTLYRTAKGKNCKSVITVHDLTHQLFFSGPRRIVNTFQLKKSVENADGIICVSENTKNDLFNFFPHLSKKKVTVIYNSAEEIFHEQKNSNFPRTIGIDPCKIILFVGSRQFYKHFDFAVNCVKQTSDLILVSIGGGELSKSEKEMVEPLGHRFFHFSGFSSQDLCYAYNNCLCLLYPSEYEGFGIPVLEAMKCGCPFIAMNKSSIPEVARGTGFLLNKLDVDIALEYMSKLNDSIFRDKISKREMEESRFFSWEKSYNELLDFYSRVISTN